MDCSTCKHQVNNMECALIDRPFSFLTMSIEESARQFEILKFKNHLLKACPGWEPK